MSGLINYYGRTPESDNIHVKPVLLQKGNTKLALYGLSNVRDERLYRTFREGGVKFFRSDTQKDDWFNLCSIHQNRHAYTDNGYIPEHFLPDMLDLVVWGHEHECRIDPETNPETNFRVMQPGSSVATSLVPGESEPKHVAILNIRGKGVEVENIRLKTIRPFIYKDIVLSEDKAMYKIAFENENMTKVHAYLIRVIEGLIDQANEEWLDLQRESGEELDEDVVPPLPLIRVRVEYSAPGGGKYEMENPQRFSKRFTGRVANTADVVSYHRKRAATTRAVKGKADLPEEDVIAQLSIDNVKISKLVEEFLAAQSLSILPQNFFSDVVGQFVDKDDKNAMEDFIKQALETQVKELVASGEEDPDVDDLADLMEKIKEMQEVAFEKGVLKRAKRKGSMKPKPAGWDSDEDGAWEDNPASIVRMDEENGDGMDEEDDEDGTPAPTRATGAKGGRGRGGKAATSATRKTAAATKKAPAKSTTAKGKKKQISDADDDEEEEEQDDVIMLDDDDDDEGESQGLFVTQSRSAPKKTTTSTSRTPTTQPAKTAPTRGGKAPPTRQTQLAFASQNGMRGPAKAVGGRAAAPRRLQEPSDDEISDDDAFEPPPTAARGGRR